MALLALYKLHCPHLVPIGNPPGRKVWFRPREKDLSNTIAKVQRQRSDPHTNDTSSSHARFRKCLGTLPPPAKRRRKTAPIPAPLPPSHPHRTEEEEKAMVPMATLTTMQELCQHIHRIELPGQIGSVFQSPLLRHVFSMWPHPSAAHRLSYWLQGMLAPELDDYKPGHAESPRLLQLLQCITQLTDFLLEPIPTVETFLLILLECWNGEEYATEVFHLLSYCSLQHFSDLEVHFLEPLKKLFVKKGVRFKCRVLCCLTNLLKFWAALEWPRYRRKMETQPRRTQPRSSVRLSVFPGSLWNVNEDLDFDPVESIGYLVRHVEDLLRLALFQEEGHTLINHAVATFYEVVTVLPEGYGIPLLLVPHPQIVNQSLLALEPTALSRILSCCVSCKWSLPSIRKYRHDASTIDTFNGVLLDMCDCLWRNLAFSAYSRPHTHLFNISEERLRSCGVFPVKEKFSVIHHPALLGFVQAFFKNTQDHNHHKFKPKAIWKEQRHKYAYLDYLEHKLLTGIHSFIHTFIRQESEP